MMDYPGKFEQAIQSTSTTIRAGDRLLLRGSAFTGEYSATLQGIKDRSIVFAPYPGEAPVIDGSLYFRGEWTTAQDLEITDADFLVRETQLTGSMPADIPTRDGIRIEKSAPNIRVQNCIVHDCRQGVLMDMNSSGNELNGCLIYNNGWVGPDRGHGHGIYLSNNSEAQKRTIDCIIFGQFGWGLHFYTEGNPDPQSQLVRNIYTEGCTMFGNAGGNIIGGSGYGSTARICTVKNCYFLDNLQMGGTTSGSIDCVFQDNVIVGNFTMLYFGNLPTITGNKFFGTVTIKDGDNGGAVVDHEVLFPDNEYLDAIPDCYMLRPRRTKANLSIFNGSQAESVTVDVSAVYADGTQVTARNVQDYLNDIQALTVTGGQIAVDMRAASHTVVPPQGWAARETTFPSFGCFVLSS